jgi:hypothetical protein
LRGIKTHEFISSTELTATTDSEDLGCGYAQNLTFFCTGDANAVIEFEAKSIDNDYYAIRCSKVGSTTIDTSVTHIGDNQAWQADLTGFEAFRTRISSVNTSGELVIKGRLCD